MDFSKKLAQLEKETNAKKAQLQREMDFYEQHKTALDGLDWEMISDRVYIKNPESFAAVVGEFPPTNTETNIGFAAKNSVIVDSPFRCDLKNPGQISQYMDFELRVIWQIDGLEICVTYTLDTPRPGPHNLPHVVNGHRKISDSEYVYYPGVSNKKLREMTIPRWEFTGLARITWYGGNQTLTDVEQINDIIEALN